jgi:hypothetical protein
LYSEIYGKIKENEMEENNMFPITSGVAFKEKLNKIEQLGLEVFARRWANYPSDWELDATYKEDGYAKIDFFEGDLKLENDLYALFFTMTINNEVVIAAVRNNEDHFDISSVKDTDDNVEFYIIE